MGIIIWLVVGGICGWLASLIMRTDAQQGIILNIVVGIVGAVIAGLLFGGGASLNNGITIKSSHLTATVYGLKGLEASQFEAVANEAEKACPVSNAYRGSLQITLDAKVG